MGRGALRTLTIVAAATVLATVHNLPAQAHDPAQHDAQLLPASMAEFDLGLVDSSLPSSSFECTGGMAGPYPCKDVDLESFVSLPELGGATGNDIWGWTDPKTKREYALVGTSTSTGFVDVTDPKNPVVVGFLPTRGTPDFVLWRDIKVNGKFAFIVSEISGSGLQVFDLTRLRGATGSPPKVFSSDAAYDGFSSAHNIAINTDTDYAYAVGSDTCVAHEGTDDEEHGGLHMVDISKPLQPRFAGCALNENSFAPDGQSNNYVHDVECVVYDGPDADYAGREICLGSNENVVTIYDVTDKQNPRVISNTGYPTASYTHQGSLTENRRWFLFGDELDEQERGLPTTTYIMDVADLDAPPTPVRFSHGTNSIDHNLYVHDSLVYESNYMAGLRILSQDDASLAAGQLREVAYFDVVPALDVADFAGTWSNYRFPRSKTTVVSAIENEISGLFVLKPRVR